MFKSPTARYYKHRPMGETQTPLLWSRTKETAAASWPAVQRTASKGCRLGSLRWKAMEGPKMGLTWGWQVIFNGKRLFGTWPLADVTWVCKGDLGLPFVGPFHGSSEISYCKVLWKSSLGRSSQCNMTMTSNHKNLDMQKKHILQLANKPWLIIATLHFQKPGRTGGVPPPEYMGISIIGVPQNGWFIREMSFEMDDLGVSPLMETSIYQNDTRKAQPSSIHPSQKSRCHMNCWGFCRSHLLALLMRPACDGDERWSNAMETTDFFHGKNHRTSSLEHFLASHVAEYQRIVSFF